MPGSFSFGKTHRILSERDFRRIKRRGLRKTSKHYILLEAENKHDIKRLGIIVTKKVGNAAVRNRWKRWTREFFRLNKDLFKESTDSVFIIKKGLDLPKSYNVVERELKKLLKSSK